MMRSRETANRGQEQKGGKEEERKTHLFDLFELLPHDLLDHPDCSDLQGLIRCLSGELAKEHELRLLAALAGTAARSDEAGEESEGEETAGWGAGEGRNGGEDLSRGGIHRRVSSALARQERRGRRKGKKGISTHLDQREKRLLLQSFSLSLRCRILRLLHALLHPHPAPIQHLVLSQLQHRLLERHLEHAEALPDHLSWRQRRLGIVGKGGGGEGGEGREVVDEEDEGAETRVRGGEAGRREAEEVVGFELDRFEEGLNMEQISVSIPVRLGKSRRKGRRRKGSKRTVANAQTASTSFAVSEFADSERPGMR
jgi:hypothetical protein